MEMSFPFYSPYSLDHSGMDYFQVALDVFLWTTYADVPYNQCK